MSRVLLSMSVLLLILIPACSSSEPVPPPTNSELVTSAKQDVLEFVASAKKAPKASKQQGMVLFESLEPIEDPALAELQATAKSLSEQYTSNAEASKISETLTKLQQQAEAL